MTAVRQVPVASKLTADQAMVMLVTLLRRLFAHIIPAMKATPIRRRFEKDLFDALHRLEREPESRIDDLPPAVQRLMYEMLSQYIMMYAQSPGLALTVSVRPGMSEGERLSALLRQEVIQRSWPYPQSVPL